MRSLILLMTSLMVGSLSACANLADDPPPDGGTGGSGWPPVTIACTNNITPDVSLLDWELGVSPKRIESGEPFTATLVGAAVFSESFFDAAQMSVRGGVEKTNLVDLHATVHVRSGATGADVTLELAPVEYQCALRPPITACDPANDLPSVPGQQPNPDCQPQGPGNPCGRFFFIPISRDCAPGGMCEVQGKTEQCDLNTFCVIGGLSLPLQEAPGQYTAAAQGEVLFGWDDVNTGATEQEGGANDGTWNLSPAVYEEPTGPVGLRATVGGILVALECTMGVDCMTNPNVDCVEALSSPTPNSELISFEIEQPL